MWDPLNRPYWLCRVKSPGQRRLVRSFEVRFVAIHAHERNTGPLDLEGVPLLERRMAVRPPTTTLARESQSSGCGRRATCSA
jgi:hypothetical protein